MKHHFLPVFTLLALLGACWAAYAQNPAPPQFIFPVACTLGQDCWTVNYVDTDPAAEIYADFTCGSKSNDDHKGTDFALRSLAEMEEGVDVLAAAAGKVARRRDGEDDTPKTPEEMDAIKAAQKECGNAVLLDHGSGLLTLYCHLKKDSVAVKVGNQVKAGQKIAQVGHSGLAEFPHLHFGVVWEGGVVDPYTGLLNTDGCGKTKQSPKEPLWALGLPMHYEPVAFYDAGFSGTIPDFESVKKGEPAPLILSADSKAFVFWIALYGVRKDDMINIEIRDPEGRVFAERALSQDKNRARQYYFTGRKTTGPLSPGTYTGTATLTRKTEKGEEIKTDISRSIIVN